jgi:hypothetical protein
MYSDQRVAGSSWVAGLFRESLVSGLPRNSADAAQIPFLGALRDLILLRVDFSASGAGVFSLTPSSSVALTFDSRAEEIGEIRRTKLS